MTSAFRLIIADPGLIGPMGHHLAYTDGLAAAALQIGIMPFVIAGSGFVGSIDGGRIAYRACFATRYQTSGGGGRARHALFAASSYLPASLAARVAPPLRELRRRLRRSQAAIDCFGSELKTALEEVGDVTGDDVLLHSVSAANLASLPGQLEPTAIRRLLVVLRRTPEDMDTDDPAPVPMAELLRTLRGIYGARLHLFADTTELAQIFAMLSGGVVSIVPPPADCPDPLTRQVQSPPHLVFPGGARLEKNYHLLPAIVAACRGRARFTLHAGPLSTSADPLIQQAHRILKRMAGTDLHIIEQALPRADYWRLLQAADMMLLPYDAASYGPRSSGILVESLALGIPALVPAGCWMEFAGGADRKIVMYGADDAPAAALRALDVLPALTEAARSGAGAWRRHHSARAVLERLMDPLPSAT